MLLVCAALFALSTPASAPQEPKPAVSADVACEAIEKEFDALQEAFYGRMRAAKDDAERDRLMEKERPDAKPFVVRLLEIADRSPKTDAAARALVWIVLHTRGQDSARDALGRIVRDHLDSPRLADLCYDLSFEDDAYVGEALERVAEKSTVADVRGKALYCLAHHRLRMARMARRLRDDSDPEAAAAERKDMDAAKLATFEKLDPARLEKDVEALLERVAKEHPDVVLFDKKLAVWAAGDLFEMRNLVVGKAAPDIQGEDVGGTAFKLSDYRGKVVVLDFWGNW